MDPRGSANPPLMGGLRLLLDFSQSFYSRLVHPGFGHGTQLLPLGPPPTAMFQEESGPDA